jgi:MYXO-CTERM domain-containing protein
MLLGSLALLFCAAAPSPAEACGPLAPLPPVGVPRSAATGVSTATSLIVFSRGAPTGFSLQAGGQDVPLGLPEPLGGGSEESSGPAQFWQLRPATADGLLVASAEHVLTATFQGASVEVTRFTTAAGYDKVQGTAPVLNSVHLWRVRYPVADIASGNCVFAEYHGFITVDYAAGTVPNTPPASVIHTFSLAPKTGGSAQTFVYVGEAPFRGLEPVGDYPLPIGAWQPELDPTREYCLSVSAFGDGDIARLGLASQEVCADVVQLSAAGAPPSGATGNGGGCGCAVTGRASSSVGAMLLAFAVALGLRRKRR